MRYVPNTENNLKDIMEWFRGVAWINYKFFYKNKPIRTNGADEDFTPLKEKCSAEGHVMQYCPKEYIQLL
jgi:integrase/recombinase XerD